MVSTQTFKNAVLSEDDSALRDIHLKTKNIAIYHRDIKSLKQELDQIAKRMVKCQVSGTKEDILSVLKDYFDSYPTKYTALYDDISKLLGLFESITKVSSFRLMLTTVSTNRCRKFHTDINDLRLLCTYVGPGTLWLPEEAINQSALQIGGSHQDIAIDEQQVQQVGTGDVVILKGAFYPEANAVLHRSPAIEKDGLKRLLLRIDTNEFLNFLE